MHVPTASSTRCSQRSKKPSNTKVKGTQETIAPNKLQVATLGSQQQTKMCLTLIVQHENADYNLYRDEHRVPVMRCSLCLRALLTPQARSRDECAEIVFLERTLCAEGSAFNFCKPETKTNA